MANVNGNQETSIVLEGMYNGFAGKLEEVKSSVSRELHYGSTQQVAAYEALSETVKQSVDAILSEFRYLSQQSSVIHEITEQGRSESQAVLLEAVQTRSEETEKRVEERLAAVEEKFTKRLAELENSLMSLTNAILGMKPVDSRKIVDEVVEKLSATVAEQAAQKSEEPVAEKVEEPVERAYEPVYEPVYAPFDEAQINYDLLAQKVADAIAADERFDINVIAEKLAAAIADPDYEPLVDRIVASIPITDADVVADKVIAALPANDDQLLAERVADAIPPVDYDLIAERVSAVLEHEFDVTVSEEGIEKIANAVSETINIDDANIVLDDSETEVLAQGVAEKINYDEIAERVARLLSEGQYTIAAQPVQAKKAPVVELAVAAEASAPQVSPVVLVPAREDDPEMFTRLKKSFEAKIIESEDSVKEYYGELKNAFLSFSKVNSQMSWSNDRFTFNRETLAKITIRGKTLCLYLALDPDEFPETVYHQKYAGDTKMYEKTPMMLKIKTPVAAKRGVRLIELLMERNGAVQNDIEPVDYVKYYAWRSEEELFKAGLIKTAVVEKSDLDF